VLMAIIITNVGFAGKWTSLIATQAAVISLVKTTPIPVPSPVPQPIPVPDIGDIKPPAKTIQSVPQRSYYKKQQQSPSFFRRR